MSLEKNAQCTLDLKAANSALKFFNILEESNESQGMLENKISEILSLMNVNIKSYILTTFTDCLAIGMVQDQ